MKRPTIADVAREAGVSKGAVSYALNGLPGVSETTRQRILATADSLGFRANSAARALAGAASKVVGLTLHRPPKTLGLEPFFMELISGLEAELSIHSYALLLQMVTDHDSEIAAYRRWWSDRSVDGVLVCDVRTGDERIAALAGLGLPAVVIGPPSASGPLASIWSDDGVSLIEAVEYLAALGHKRIARVGGISGLVHTAIRTETFAATGTRLGLTTVTVPTDYTGEDGARATRRLLSSPSRPTALIYDNDIMAIAGLAVAQEMGLAVPGDLSIIAWDDSPICRLVHPPLTAMTRDISAYGTHAARLLLSAIDGKPVTSMHDEPAHLTPRGSTAPPKS
ncbi:DNA-binding LacI/PurR family transcriptional regulator [Allocatelliglobosispora scoriae]|uniref:DNA-binding LacI/PurR family transcriptional regulator n=1 Tax=Allocatelliglobosispora scoriae TaxID=643052 RepID=A0A841C0I1_9ACTN|nr:LacI family DNA-binding transcriptional regulator [Allocatelliglobosispora scoriae]MBB5873884.1 DNA-binding LacI/PurR family transcriptional regulator [Allocatelliglobosispora scoriae]